MSNNTSKHLTYDWPHDISYDSDRKHVDDFYSKINGAISEKSSIFYQKRQIDIFLLAMAIGKSMGSRELIRKPSHAIRRDALNEIEAWMMCSVALSDTKSLDVLAEPSKAVRICEEYANGGIDTLIALDKRPGDSVYEEFLKDVLEKS